MPLLKSVTGYKDRCTKKCSACSSNYYKEKQLNSFNVTTINKGLVNELNKKIKIESKTPCGTVENDLVNESNTQSVYEQKCKGFAEPSMLCSAEK